MSKTRNPRLDIDGKLLRKLYLEDLLGYVELEKMFRINGSSLKVTLDHYKIPRRKTGPRSPQHCGTWNGGRNIDKDGYVLLYRPDHPDATVNGYIREHRAVMEKKIGRRLLKTEVVHHKNKVKDDNRPENLELFAKNSDHLRHELTGKCPKWTADGKRRIMEGVRKPRNRRKKTIAHDNQQPGAPSSP